MSDKFVALATGATGVSSVHLIQHLQKDNRFSKIYGVSRRPLYDVGGEVEHLKIDLLNYDKVVAVLEEKGVNDGKLLKPSGRYSYQDCLCVA